jgi:hypothetical protein
VPTKRDLDDVVARLERGDVVVSDAGGGFAASDPSSNHVQITARELQR